jgi:Transposase IS116/IS110/IS902 family
MRQRAERLAQVHNTNSPYNRPESGKQMASKANRDGGADRCAAPAVPKSSAIDLALITSYAQLLNDGDLSLVKAAKPHDAHPLSLRQTVPGSGKMLSLVLLYAIHDMDRFPRGQDCGSSGRLVTCAKESAGQRWGTSGKKIGNAPLQWALSEAAALFLRNNPAGPHAGARLENKPGQGNALTILAHKLARAVYDMRKRQTAFAMEQCLHGEGSSGGEPAASLDMEGIRLERACATSCLTASLHAKVPRGLLSPRPRL